MRKYYMLFKAIITCLPCWWTTLTWRLLEDEEHNPKKSLALEEAIARTCANSGPKCNTLRFWTSKPSVVIGRFQCVHKEVNLEFCKKNDIDIVRRFTGGGAVYHDEGNLNFTLCLDQSESYVSRTLNELYWNFIGTIATGLQEIGIPARFDAYRSCIRINQKKITGTAGWIKQGVSFIHGTLLIDADLQMLRRSITPPPDQPEYLRDNRRIRCIESKRDIVTTINKEIEKPPSVEQIRKTIVYTMERISEQRVEPGDFFEEELELAESLYENRYRQPEWNLGTLAQ